MREMAIRLAADEKEKLQPAGTVVDLERSTVEIGDELTQQLTSSVFASRAQGATEQALTQTTAKTTRWREDKAGIVTFDAK